MPYSPLIVDPMRQELTSIGFQQLMTAGEVDAFMTEKPTSAMLVINSVCGCAAGQARPGIRLALQQEVRPERLVTVFAGQEVEATQQARSYFADIPPSSPSIALFKEGELVYFVPRHRIESRDAEDVAADLVAAFERYFASTSRMGTFHDDTHELHGITVVVDTVGDEVFVGRCDHIDERQVILLDVDVHKDGQSGRSKSEYVQLAAQFGVWKKFARVVIPQERVASVQRLGDLADSGTSGRD